MGSSFSSYIQYCSFETLQQSNSNDVFIHTMNSDEQTILIKNTLFAQDEESRINQLIQEKKWNVNIYIYGKNWHDKKVISKYEQLKKLGFYHVYIYGGGLFEWLLLQDIYGDDLFQTTTKELDILKFKPIIPFTIE